MIRIRRTARRPGRAGRVRRLVPRAALLLALALLTAGCQSNAFTRQGLPVPVTQQGRVILHMWQGSWIAAWAVGILVWGGILWAIIFHRKRSNQLPRQVRYNLPIEILYTVLPFIMVGVLFFYTAKDETYIDKIPPHPALRVHVIGEQWTWQFIYPQYPAKTGQPVKEIGDMWRPGLGATALPLLEIPTGETVQFTLTSLDVIHSFWISPFLFKRDLLPEPVPHRPGELATKTTHQNTFTVTLIRKGTFIGRCSELCGVYHSRMLFRVKIVSLAQFKHWIHAQQAMAQPVDAGGAQ